MRSSLLAALVLVWAASDRVAATETVASVAADRWIEVRTKHLRILSNAPVSRVQPVADLLEAFQEVVRTSTNGLARPSGGVDTVFVFKDDASFDPFKFQRDDPRTQLMGFFHATSEARLVALNATPKQHIEDARAFRSFQSPYETLLHEYTHAIVKASFPGLPMWLNEGMAVYFSTTWIDGTHAAVGRPTHTAQLALNGTLPVHLDALSKVPSFHGLPAGSLLPAYGTAWVAVHYLFVGGPERNKQFMTYLGRLASGAAAGSSFERAFGEPVAALEPEVRRYAERGRYVVRRYPLESLGVGETSEARPLSEDEARIALAELLAQTRDYDRCDAGALVAPILAKDPTHARALGAKGLVAEYEGRGEEAVEVYRSALSRAPDDPILQLRLGRALTVSQEVAWEKLVRPPAESVALLTEARRLIESALLERPDLSGAYSYLGLTYIGEPGDHARGRALLEESRKRDPKIAARLLVPLGAMHLWDGDRAGALELLKSPATTEAADATSRLRWILLERDRFELEGLGGSGGPGAQKAWVEARIHQSDDPAIVDQLKRWGRLWNPPRAPDVS